MEEIKCKCGKKVAYDYNYQCFNCECGKCYNAFSQELAPLENWKNEFDDDNY